MAGKYGKKPLKTQNFVDKFSTLGILLEIIGVKTWWITCRVLSKNRKK